jgi:hypothetical protein
MLNKVLGRIRNKLGARDADFHYFTAPPEFTLWDEGTKRKYGRLFDRTWKVPVLRYQSAIEWDRIDEEDDLTDRFRTQLQDTANKAIEIEINAYFAILQGTASPSYLRTLPLAADGLSVFSSGRTNYFPGTGNVILGSGVSTPAQIVNDFFKVRSSFTRVVDDNGTLYHREGILREGMTIIFNDQLMKVFTEAFEAQNYQVSGAAPENVVTTRTKFGNITLWGTSRVTGNNWHCVVDAMPEKGIFALERRDLGSEPETILKTEAESDYCSDYDVRRLQFRKRIGFGVSLPLGMIQVTNA